MTDKLWGIIIGGFIPAIFFGFSTIVLKAGAESKISTPNFLIINGIMLVLVGIIFKPILNTPQQIESLSFLGISWSCLSGLLRGLGITSISFAVTKFSAPISVLTPIFNMNTLVAVLGGMLIFSEWKTLDRTPLFIGTFLVIAGGLFLSKA